MSLLGQGAMSNVLFGFGTGNLVYSVNTDISNTGDIYCDSLTVNSGATLKASGCRIFAKRFIYVDTGSAITANGNSAAGSVAGVNIKGLTAASATLGPGDDGATGGTTAGVAGGSFAGFNYKGVGGGGGGGGPIGTGGAGGTTGFATFLGQDKGLQAILNGWGFTNNSNIIFLAGGAGGGSGAGSGGTAGGGGAGGNALMLASPLITLFGNVTALGGTGGNAVSGNSSGGGGGGGGTILMMFGDLITDVSLGFNNTRIFTTGGVGGTHLGSGHDGFQGSAGSIYIVDGVFNKIFGSAYP